MKRHPGKHPPLLSAAFSPSLMAEGVWKEGTRSCAGQKAARPPRPCARIPGIVCGPAPHGPAPHGPTPHCPAPPSLKGAGTADTAPAPPRSPLPAGQRRHGAGIGAVRGSPELLPEGLPGAAGPGGAVAVELRGERRPEQARGAGCAGRASEEPPGQQVRGRRGGRGSGRAAPGAPLAAAVRERGRAGSGAAAGAGAGGAPS